MTAAALLLLQLGDTNAAEARLVAESERLAGSDYVRLAPLAKDLQTRGCLRGATVVYRALLNDILVRGYARAYGHAARYWRLLAEIAGSGIDLEPLPCHEDFDAGIRVRHKRKSSFWASVSQLRGDGRDEDDRTS